MKALAGVILAASLFTGATVAAVFGLRSNEESQTLNLPRILWFEVTYSQGIEPDCDKAEAVIQERLGKIVNGTDTNALSTLLQDSWTSIRCVK